ncbi:MAG TPA: hypothetical protein VNN07_02170 [Candidatus Tectomicrobia bacterium]|nr:hypothetical protein [Candidatus Tectomicrobia bacterium]
MPRPKPAAFESPLLNSLTDRQTLTAGLTFFDFPERSTTEDLGVLLERNEALCRALNLAALGVLVRYAERDPGLEAEDLRVLQGMTEGLTFFAAAARAAYDRAAWPREVA